MWKTKRTILSHRFTTINSIIIVANEIRKLYFYAVGEKGEGQDYENIVNELYDLAYKKYKDTEFEVTRKEIEKMYFLTSVNLKEDNKTWWLVLEPNFNVTSIYNHFLRFTMLDRKIVWANFDINTTA